MQINIDKMTNAVEFEGHIAPDGEMEDLLLFAFNLKPEDKVEVWGMCNEDLTHIDVFLVKPTGAHFRLEENQIDMDDLIDKITRRRLTHNL